MSKYGDQIVVFENDFIRVVVEPCWEPGREPLVLIGVELSWRLMSKLVDFIPEGSWMGFLEECPAKEEAVKEALSELLIELKIDISEERIEEVAKVATAKAWAYKVSEELRS